MNVTVNLPHLLTELRLLSKIVPAKPAIQILSHILVVADTNVTFHATDLEVALTTQCDAQVHEPGSVALPAAKLLALVEQFTDSSTVTIATTEHHAQLHCGAFKSQLQTLPTRDFQPIPTAESPTNQIAAATLRQMITHTRHAISTSGAKHLIQGALLTLKEDNNAAMVATDGKRLAVAMGTQIGSDIDVIIPTKALDALAATSDDREVELTVSDRHLFFKLGERLLISRMFDATFPAYERIIPRTNTLVADINKLALVAALKRINLIAGENQAVYFHFTPNTLTLTSSSADVGSAHESLPVQYEGQQIKVCINGSYVLDFLQSALSQRVTLKLKDEKSALLLSDGDDGHYIAVIMLLRA